MGYNLAVVIDLLEKTDCFSGQAFNPNPKIQVVTFYFLNVLFAYFMLFSL